MPKCVTFHMLRTQYRLPLLLGLTHGVADCVSGFMIGTVQGDEGGMSLLALVFVYNALAFGGQLPFGMLLDRISGVKKAALAGVACIAAGLVLMHFTPIGAIVLAGIGSAIFHVAGGAASLQSDQGKAATPGLFAAPGVMGLALGGVFATLEIAAQWPLMGLLIALGAWLATMDFPAVNTRPAEKKHDLLEMHDLLMIGLLLAIAFRSAIWNVMSLAHHGDMQSLIWMGAAAMVGKIAGGFLADWLGWRNYALGALALAIPALTWGGQNAVLLMGGIALLQSATPVAIAAMHRALPRSPGTAAGLALGLGIAIGGIPTTSGLETQWIQGPAALATAGGIALLLFYFTLKKARSIPINPHTNPETTQKRRH